MADGVGGGGGGGRRETLARAATRRRERGERQEEMDEMGKDGINMGRSRWKMESRLVAVEVRAGPPLADQEPPLQFQPVIFSTSALIVICFLDCSKKRNLIWDSTFSFFSASVNDVY
jgi:hypothetical protein